MVRRSVEIHLLRHVAERKLENRDTCVYIRAAGGRVCTSELVCSGLSIKKKCRRLEIDPRSLVRAIAFGYRFAKPIRRDLLRERIMENAFSMYRQQRRQAYTLRGTLGHSLCLMQTRGTYLVRSGLNAPAVREKV